MLDEKSDASELVLESNDDVVHDETTPSAEKEEVAQQETCLAPATAKAPHHRIRPHPLLPPLPPPPLPLPSQPYTASEATNYHQSAVYSLCCHHCHQLPPLHLSSQRQPCV